MGFKFKKPLENYMSHITPKVLKGIFENHGFEVELKKEKYHGQIFLETFTEPSDLVRFDYPNSLQHSLIEVLPVQYNHQVQNFSSQTFSNYITILQSPYKSAKKSTSIIKIEESQAIESGYVCLELVGG
ncbi:MAG: hypothetical protein UHX00_12445 [Caryophanon sp.]|nr:hypothetical protein [Caryophanon sp.]